MANSNYNDVFTVTLESRSKALADNVSKNNALLSRLKEKGNLRPVSGGSKILEELEYGTGDMVWYSGYDSISYTPKQLFSAAEYALKLCAVPVAVSGEELLINSGEEQVMDLLEKRISNAEKTMCNQMSAAIYGDGTGSFGKAIGGDITSNKKTYMLINAVNRANAEQRNELTKWIEARQFDRNEKVRAVTALYDQIGIRQLCEQKISYYFDECRKYLAKVSVSDERKQMLLDYTNEMMKRRK